MRVWRITSEAHAAFDGEGARRYGSRWTPRGLAAVFTSATLSLAALERFVHADPDLEPPDLVAIPVDIPPNLEIQSVDARALPSEWRQFPPPPILTTFGERWLTSGSSVALSVPSVVIPDERNYILNPRHPDFERLAIGRRRPFSFDPRMWKGKG